MTILLLQLTEHLKQPRRDFRFFSNNLVFFFQKHLLFILSQKSQKILFIWWAHAWNVLTLWSNDFRSLQADCKVWTLESHEFSCTTNNSTNHFVLLRKNCDTSDIKLIGLIASLNCFSLAWCLNPRDVRHF